MTSRQLTTDVRRAGDLIVEWRQEADRMELRGLSEPVCLIRSMADQLEAVLGREDSEILTLREAGRESGYSPGHLGRLIREGKLPNAGRPGSPRLRRGDLPKKAGELPNLDRAFNFPGRKAAIVRSIADRKD